MSKEYYDNNDRMFEESKSVHFSQTQKDLLKFSIKMRKGNNNNINKLDPAKVIDENKEIITESKTYDDEIDLNNNKSILTTKINKYSYDIVRTKLFDSSSRLLNPSQLQTIRPTSEFNVVDKDSYCAPCDRIGRWYTASAAGFTMNNATAVAKRLLEQKNAPKVVGFCLAATAPDAFNAVQRIADKAISDNSNNMTSPTVVVCNTVKGKGVSFAENSAVWHYKTLTHETLEIALNELK